MAVPCAMVLLEATLCTPPEMQATKGFCCTYQKYQYLHSVFPSIVVMTPHSSHVVVSWALEEHWLVIIIEIMPIAMDRGVTSELKN